MGACLRYNMNYRLNWSATCWNFGVLVRPFVPATRSAPPFHCWGSYKHCTNMMLKSNIAWLGQSFYFHYHEVGLTVVIDWNVEIEIADWRFNSFNMFLYIGLCQNGSNWYDYSAINFVYAHKCIQVWSVGNVNISINSLLDNNKMMVIKMIINNFRT